MSTEKYVLGGTVIELGRTHTLVPGPGAQNTGNGVAVGVGVSVGVGVIVGVGQMPPGQGVGVGVGASCTVTAPSTADTGMSVPRGVDRATLNRSRGLGPADASTAENTTCASTPEPVAPGGTLPVVTQPKLTVFTPMVGSKQKVVRPLLLRKAPLPMFTKPSTSGFQARLNW
jgi:hypothetical protein